MSKPASLSDLHFHVIDIANGHDAKGTSVVMVAGKDTEGKLRLWVDGYSSYSSDHDNPDVRAAIRAMSGKETPFLEAPEVIRNEWTEKDGSWSEAAGAGVEI